MAKVAPSFVQQPQVHHVPKCQSIISGRTAMFCSEPTSFGEIDATPFVSFVPTIIVAINCLRDREREQKKILFCITAGHGSMDDGTGPKHPFRTSNLEAACRDLIVSLGVI